MIEDSARCRCRRRRNRISVRLWLTTTIDLRRVVQDARSQGLSRKGVQPRKAHAKHEPRAPQGCDCRPETGCAASAAHAIDVDTETRRMPKVGGRLGRSPESEGGPTFSRVVRVLIRRGERPGPTDRSMGGARVDRQVYLRAKPPLRRLQENRLSRPERSRCARSRPHPSADVAGPLARRWRGTDPTADAPRPSRPRRRLR